MPNCPLPRSRFSVNFGTLFTEIPLPERPWRRQRPVVSRWWNSSFPMTIRSTSWKAALDATGMRLNNLNTPRRGYLPRRMGSCRHSRARRGISGAIFAQAVDYATALGAPLIHVMSGAVAHGQRDAGLSTYVANIREGGALPSATED